jgi:hypothetical protein
MAWVDSTLRHPRENHAEQVRASHQVRVEVRRAGRGPARSDKRVSFENADAALPKRRVIGWDRHAAGS